MLNEFLGTSAALGSDRRHVQGPGGNTSLKIDANTMLVKASGYELKDALIADVFARVAYRKVNEALAQGASDPLFSTFDVAGPRPSIETTLHALMPHSVVLHTHSIEVVAGACRRDAITFFSDALAGLPWAWVDYAKPGSELAAKVADALIARPKSSILVLGNHGIVVGGGTPSDARELLETVVSRLRFATHSSTTDHDAAQLERLAEVHGLAVPSDPRAHVSALHPIHVEIALRGSLYPDHVVFLGPRAGLLSQRGESAATSTALQPKLWLVPGAGVLLEQGLAGAAHALAVCLADVLQLMPEADACTYLTDTQEAELLQMEEEKYRQSLARRTR